MLTDFTILSGRTVSREYSWDAGLPTTTNSTTITSSSTIEQISGYAPNLTVKFKNNSTTDSDYTFINYTWNFGDYYNSNGNNVSLSCTLPLEHTYIMPGIYTVALTHTQSKVDVNPLFNYSHCRGRYNYQWYWDSVASNKPETLTWDQTNSGATYEKLWIDETNCLQKYCKKWTWFELKSTDDASNPVKWEQTQSFGTKAVYPKKWQYEANDTVCDVGVTFLNTLCATTQNTIKTYLVQVIELPPTAELYTITKPTTGVTPLTATLTPRTTKAGSFPIDRIDWNFGDGAPTITVSRYAIPDLTLFTYTCAFSADPLDPRNYDATYVYKRTANTYSVFYPSITAYHSSTGTFDTCSTTIGPISLSTLPTDQIHLLKGYSSPSGQLYGLQVGNNITFVVPQNNLSSPNIVSNTPPNIIKNILNTSVLYPGNSGGNYPTAYTTPQCTT